MDIPRNTLPKNVSLKEFQLLIETIEKSYIKKYNVPYRSIYAKDLIEYFGIETPTGDVTTLKDVILNKWLLLHELIELSEIKKMGINLSPTIFTHHYIKVLEAHITATEWEFYIVKKESDTNWLEKRVVLVEDWLQDPELTYNMEKRYRELFKEYSDFYNK